MALRVLFSSWISWCLSCAAELTPLVWLPSRGASSLSQVHIVRIGFGSSILMLLDEKLGWREIDFTGIRLSRLLEFVCGGCKEAREPTLE